MDRAMQLRHLEMAHRHIAQGARIIADQKERISEAVLRGSGTMESRLLLENFERLQVQHMEHRDRIIVELG